MEHRLIQGGEQFLAFARSCITKLKKLGLPYASQSFEVDGVSIKVRIEPGHEYIRIDGGSCLFDMDSGVVELPAGDIYGAGVLHWAGAANAYNSVFTVPVAGRLTHTGATGQFSGQVRVPAQANKAKGSVLANKSPAPSYSPDGIEDENLKNKRQNSMGGGASIYTGKARLYIQAVLGTPLYERNKSGKVTGSNSYPEGGYLDPYVKPGTNPDPYPGKIKIGTGCGVYLDQTTGKHWMFLEQETSIAVLPLISSACGEKNRRHLITATSKLNAVDRGHLETYILARSRPDPAQAQSAATGLLPAGITMGYRWHWAWSTAVADMVVNDGIMRVNGGSYEPAMRSSHYRLTMTQAADTKVIEDGVEVTKPGMWSASVSTVEGGKEWMVNRQMFPIMEPVGGYMNKITGTTYNMFSCDAPFYVFYVRDKIHVCRISVTDTKEQMDRETTPFFSDTAPGTTHGVPGWSMGSAEGESSDTLVPRHWEVRVTCGDWTSPPGYMSWQRSKSGFKVYAKEKGPAPTGYPASLSSDYAEGNFSQLPVGAPSGSPPGTHAMMQTDHPYRDTRGYTGFTSTEFYYNTYKNTSFVVAVPYGDAEALYFRSTAHEETNNTFTSYRRYGGHVGWGGTWEIWSVGSTNFTQSGHLESTADRSDWAQHSTFYGEPPELLVHDPEHEVKIETNTILLGRAAGADALIPKYDYHVGSEQTAYVRMFTMSGAGSESPIVHSPDLPIDGVVTQGRPNIGMPSDDIPFPVIVGWV